MALAATPPPGTTVPRSISEWARRHGREVAELVWLSGVGAVTARLVAPDSKALFAKWSPVDLLPEAERMSWLSSRHPCPRLFDFQEEEDGWLIVSGALPGASAVSPRWKTEPDRAAAAIGDGLAMLHALDPAISMFGEVDWADGQDDIDQLVIAHGDACAPNTIIVDDGSFVGHVDLGSLGVADRWADLAIASWSLEWNFGPGHEAPFWDAYGISPDPDRIAQYRALWGDDPTGAARQPV
ncbi:kanamycin kinase [Tessaracoccus bendigoensis DSM 12906]|uniref:Kanamycin kinase n=1 Tax=Tessaracoccus bendigoensis DSM 12906 TaxID=1123357 RepID=A0A1M6IMD1_9ACTN|nr:aminoglycoside 3'-phosphotransferase [Tessaracoccus bendigoensis]SHJ35588.1 kanamycin kinase [Tessaracoccus bendigoensis DSM 12906]